MVYRFFAATIIVFWLTMTALLVRNEVAPDGSSMREVPVSHMVIGHRDADGRIERYSAVMRDISGAMQAQHELMRQTATLRSVADAIPATVAVVDRAGLYRFVNRAFTETSRIVCLKSGSAYNRSLRYEKTTPDTAARELDIAAEDVSARSLALLGNAEQVFPVLHGARPGDEDRLDAADLSLIKPYLS